MARSTHVRRPVAPDDLPGAVDTRRIRDTDPAGPRGGRPSRIGTRAHPDVTEDGHSLADGDVLVAAMTSPDWVTTVQGGRSTRRRRGRTAARRVHGAEGDMSLTLETPLIAWLALAGLIVALIVSKGRLLNSVTKALRVAGLLLLALAASNPNLTSTRPGTVLLEDVSDSASSVSDLDKLAVKQRLPFAGLTGSTEACTAGAVGAILAEGVGKAGCPSFAGICTEISCFFNVDPAGLRLGSPSKIIGRKTIPNNPMVAAPISRRRPRRFNSISVALSSGDFVDAMCLSNDCRDATRSWLEKGSAST